MQMGNFRREMEVRKSQMEMMFMKNVILEINIIE